MKWESAVTYCICASGMPSPIAQPSSKEMNANFGLNVWLASWDSSLRILDVSKQRSKRLPSVSDRQSSNLAVVSAASNLGIRCCVLSEKNG